MRLVDDYEKVPPFEVLAPSHQRAPFVFNAPHSGTVYRRDILRRSRLDRQTIRRSEDTFVDGLFAGVVELGAPLLKANFPRVYVDLNRAEDELDPEMFDGPIGRPVAADSARVAGGLGVIAKIVGERQDIYHSRLPAGEAGFRIDNFYRPYHAALADLVDATLDRFGACVLIDCHSMPSGAVRVISSASGSRPDVIIGDRFGTSCSPALTDALASRLRDEGFVVGRNRPYAGGHITEHYGRPPAVHAVQLEINRALYMDETAYARKRSFSRLQNRLTAICQGAIEDFNNIQWDGEWPLAAE
ncbi:MAG: N-formylglutamate amidohydrolase [Pseudomonadota bacterium]